MTAPRGPQRSEDRSDLTPAEARAEVETFLGEGWNVNQLGIGEGTGDAYVQSVHGDVRVFTTGPTYRAAVSALKSAWRDAVRPWCVAAASEWDDCYSDEANLRRVLKEDDK